MIKGKMMDDPEEMMMDHMKEMHEVVAETIDEMMEEVDLPKPLVVIMKAAKKMLGMGDDDDDEEDDEDKEKIDEIVKVAS